MNTILGSLFTQKRDLNASTSLRGWIITDHLIRQLNSITWNYQNEHVLANVADNIGSGYSASVQFSS